MDLKSQGKQPNSDGESIRTFKRKLTNRPQNAKRVKRHPVASKGNKNKPQTPSIEELEMTETSYGSTLFKLQIDELLNEVKVKIKRKNAFNDWLKSFEEALSSLPQREILFSQHTKYSIKCRRLRADKDLTLKLHGPERIECFGLYANKAFAGPHLKANVNVVMPRVFFHVKDFLNNRYLVKRTIYLNYIAEYIQAHKIQVVYYDNNRLLPVLHVQPTEDEKLSVEIHCTPSESYFKPQRLLPNQNNMKVDLFGAGFSDIEVLKTNPTTLYNSVLAHDVTLNLNSEFVKTTLAYHEHVQQAIKLLCVWLKQRELDVGYGAFTQNVVMYLVTYMLAKKKINKFMNPYEVVRSFWRFIASLDLQNNPISLSDCSEATFALFRQHFSLVFLDKTGCYNLAAFLDINVFEKVKFECSLAVKHLDANNPGAFQSLFLTKLPFVLQYDLILDVSEALPLTSKHFIFRNEQKAEYIGFEHILSLNHLHDLLKKGLSKRTLHIVPRIEPKKAFFGINLNPETAFNILELGPELNHFEEADEFRRFWGYLSSDRRFRDGSAHAAVYFRTATCHGKRNIPKRIIQYLLMEKVDIKFKLYYNELEDFIINKMVTSPFPMGTNEEGTLKITTLADELGQKLRGLQMSLSITGIQDISDTFNYSQPFPPIASNYKFVPNIMEIKGKNFIFTGKKFGMMPRYIEPLEMVLQLEHSSKWPNNLEAIRHLKTAFYLEISKLFEKHHGIISNVTKDYLQVFYGGLVFRYRLHVTKEVVLMKKQLLGDGSTSSMDNPESEEYEQQLDILPKVNAALKGLQMQFPSFGPGTALIKRWLRAQLLDQSQLPDVVVNLLSASLFVNPTGFSEPCTPQISLFRFLKFMTELQWELEPVQVNFNQEISKEDIADLESEFQQHRSQVQPLYIIMPYDQGQSVFTKRSPSKEILGRVQLLSEQTMNLIIKRMMGALVFELKDLFTANLEGYDVVIHLKPLQNPRRHEGLNNPGNSRIELEEYKHKQEEIIPIVGFNPVELYLKTLRENYGELAIFFHNPYGGNTVAVLWYPHAKEPKEFMVSNVSGRKLKDGKLVLNKDAILEDFNLLGKGIVKTIEKK